MRTGLGRGTVGACVLFVCLLGAAPAAATSLPLDALGPLGDVHVLFPPYAVDDTYTPAANVGAVGDVNGDGVEDTAMALDSYKGGYPATTWVTFSPVALPRTVAAGRPAWNGLRIRGAQAWRGVTGLGDVNGDGLGEVAIAALDPQGNSDGDIVVVFGSRTSKQVDIDDLGSRGFRIANVSYLVSHGFGTLFGGTVWQNTTLTSAGDQNGDGRPDLAFRDGYAIKVAYTPAHPGGATVNAGALGKHGFTLSMETGNEAQWYGPFVGRLGDLNHDGRADLLVGWGREDDHTARVTGVVSPGPGAVVGLGHVADAGKGFELTVPESTLENTVVLGDQNGDGRRDAGVVTYGDGVHSQRDRSLTIGYAPPLGVKRQIRPAPRQHAADLAVPNSDVHDVGDQDRDGRSDIAYANVVRFSRDGHVSSANPRGLGGALYLAGVERPIVTSVADRTGDGKRELVSAFSVAAPGKPRSLALWTLDIWMSATLPLPRILDLPADLGDVIEFSGLFKTATQKGIRSLGARASVQLTGPGIGTKRIVDGSAIDAGRPKTEAVITIDPARLGLVPGRRYSYRILLENNRGLVGKSAVRSFLFRPEGGFTLRRGTNGADRIHGAARRDRVLAAGGPDEAWGGPAADVLFGGRGDDVLHGEAGADVLVGGAGADALSGGGGDDVVSSRDGKRDRVYCGAGRDRVRADGRDRVSGCESVRRG